MISHVYVQLTLVLLPTSRFMSMIVISSKKKLMKTKEASGNGLRGLLVDELFLPIVSIKVFSKSISPTVITKTMIKARPRFSNAGCGEQRITGVPASFRTLNGNFYSLKLIS